MASIFSKIIRGEIPSYKIYEDEHVYAFLDIRPIHLGHTLVVPKIEVDHFFDCPEPHYTKLQLVAQKIARALKEATGAPRIGTAVQGFEVPHFHLHLIPLWSPRDLDFTLGHSRSEEDMKAIQADVQKRLSQP